MLLSMYFLSHLMFYCAKNLLRLGPSHDNFKLRFCNEAAINYIIEKIYKNNFARGSRKLILHLTPYPASGFSIDDVFGLGDKMSPDDLDQIDFGAVDN